MNVKKHASSLILKSDLKRVDSHEVQRHEYDELPELSDAMLAMAIVNKGGRPKLAQPRQLISLRLPADVVANWRATGPGWQTRMAAHLASGPRELAA